VKGVTSPPQADTAGSRTLSGEPVAELYTEADLEAGLGAGHEAALAAGARAPTARPPDERPEDRIGRPGAPPLRGADPIGRPGQYPFTRGVYESMYRGRLWTMRQFAGFGTSEETNERFHYLLEHGQTGLSTAFDMPSLMGFDSDSPRSLGEIGREGVAVDTVEDMRTLFGGIDLGEVSVSMTINAPAAIMLAFYVAAAESAAEGFTSYPPDSAAAAASDGAGVPAAGAADAGASNGRLLEHLSGTIQADILKEYIAQKEWCFPIDPAMRLCGDMIEWCTRHMPRWHPISISGYHIREAGATAQQELAFTLADGLTYVRQAVERGLDVDEFAPRLSFFFNAQIDLFEEIAKYRAARRIWARELRETFGAKNPRSWLMRFHAQTAGVSLTAQQPLNNIVRTAVEALAAVLGGAQSLHTNSYDEALALPTEEAVRVALRTQQVIAHETGVASTADPLGGSYFVEAMTDRMERRCYEYFEKIAQLGGMVEAVKRNYPQREIADAAFELQREIDTGERIVVGVNSHVLENEQPIPTLRVDPALERKQLDRLQAARARRDGAAVERTLAALRAAAAQPDRNLMHPLLHCARACASEGEIVESLQQVFGDYTETPVF
jgi:methylmalonyl-CoA mutase N-terminal domain/subunit